MSMDNNRRLGVFALVHDTMDLSVWHCSTSQESLIRVRGKFIKLD